MSRQKLIGNEPAAVAARYDQLAPHMEELERRMWMPPGFRGRAIAAMKLPRGGRVCVVGCGAGPELPYLVEALGGDSTIDGIDLSPALIARAEARRQAEGWTNVRLQVADAGKFAASEPYDGVLFAFSLIAMSPYHEDVLRHMWGHVAPGGCMTVMDSRMPWFLRWARPFAQRYVNRTYLGDMRIRPKECLSAFGPVQDYSEKWDAFFAHTVFNKA